MSTETAPFAVLSDDVRLGILETLAERLRESPDEPAMGFSELRRAVGMRDSGNFNYHLDQVRDRFVTRTEEGYRLSPAGMEVFGAVVAGTFAGGTPTGSIAVDEECPVCGEGATAEYDDGQLRVRCPNDHVFRNHVPPGVLEDRSLAETVRTMAVKTHRDLEMAVEGVCPNCYAHLAWNGSPAGGDGDPVEFDTRCDRCGAGYEVPATLAAAYHPAVAAFYHDHGVDVGTTPPWSPAFWDPVEVTVGRDPVAVEVAVELDGDRLVATLDRSLSVTALERP